MASRWSDHQESGSSVRSIRDWEFSKQAELPDGGTEIIYGAENDSDSYRHGHYAEDANGDTTYSRPPQST